MTVAAESTYWNDFSYAYYRDLLRLCAQRYAIAPLREFVPPTEATPPRIYLRHDIDVCFDAAVAMAEQEAEIGIAATYMVIPTSLLYSIRSEEGRNGLRRLQELGHEVAIHFDIDSSRIERPDDLEKIGLAVADQCSLISDVTGTAVASISFHRPIGAVLHGPDYLFGKVNAYSATMLRLYRADSWGRWRHGDPIAAFTGPMQRVAQLLIHPIWWGPTHEDPPRRLETFFQQATRFMTVTRARDFDKRLADTRLDVPRAGLLSK